MAELLKILTQCIIRRLHMPELQLRPFCLVAPSRGQKQKCEICVQAFSIATREHMCKRCFRAVCDSCSPYKVRSYRADLQHRLHRMCKICHKESEVIHRYAENNRVCWGEDSDMSRMWLKQLGYQSNRQAQRASYRMSSRRSMNNTEGFQTSLGDLWGSLNYSFRQFIGVAIDRSSAMNGIITNKQGSSVAKTMEMKIYKQILQQILACLSETLSTIQTPLAPEDIIYILIFFMAHSSPTNAVIFTKSIVQWLSFEKPTAEGMKYFLQKWGCSDIESYKIENYLQENLERIVHTATINYFTVQISVEIVSSLISKKSYEELEKGIAYVISLRKDFISKNSQKSDLIEIDILKNTEGLGANYRKASKSIENQGDRSVSRAHTSTASTVLARQQKYEELIRLNEELKIKNKNQEEEIIRLKAENNKLVEKGKQLQSQLDGKDQWNQVRKKSIMIQQRESFKQKEGNPRVSLRKIQDEDRFLGMLDQSQINIEEEDENNSDQNSYESYWEQQEIIQNEGDSSLPFELEEHSILPRGSGEAAKRSAALLKDDVFKKQKKTRMVKKYRCKSKGRTKKKDKDNRFSSMSEKLISLKQQNKGRKPSNQYSQNQNDKYEQMIYQKNEEISKLKKQLNLSKCNVEMAEQQLQQSRNYIDQEYEPKMKQIITEKDSIETELHKMQQMNKQLLLKLQQLSNMLMDKEEQQVAESEQTLHDLTKAYEEKTKEMGEDCRIF